jgi:transposase InsO family protein
MGYTCGSLFVDHASGKIFNFAQYSNNANETIQSAQRLESMTRYEGFRIKSYHLDNGIFSTKDFKDHCIQQHQQFSFSGVGAKHQNGIAERNIKTAAQWARANMLHLATHWPATANTKYWPQAID